MALNTHIVILVNQEWLGDNEDLVYIKTYKVVKPIQDSVDDLDKSMTLLVLKGPLHEQR